MSAPNYCIYPSLLDNYQRLLDSERDFEDFTNEDGEGNYKRTLEEIEAEREQALLDSVNRVPHETSEAQLKGTLFNDLLDIASGHGRSESERGFRYYDRECANGWCVYEVTALDKSYYYEFNGRDIHEHASAYRGAIPQYLCKATLATKYGEVLLYGYADEIVRDVVKDIKTTTRYNFGKFANKWQKELYPYCLVESGDVPSVSRFDYDVFVWKERKGEPLSVDRYTESYDYDHERGRRRLRAVCESLIEWLELHRAQITDKKVFGNI